MRANGLLVANNSTFSFNQTSGDGGAISTSAGLEFAAVTIDNNDALGGSGGGIHIGNNGGTLVNVTLSGNTATEDGGGLIANSGNVIITSTTITGNEADDRGGGIRVGGSSVDLSNSILSGNTAATNDEISGNFTSSNSRVGGLAGLNLGPLADNGGPVQTHALGAGSTAIDGGSAANPGDLDARGFDVTDGIRDQGAFEFGATNPNGPTTGTEAEFCLLYTSDAADE